MGQIVAEPQPADGGEVRAAGGIPHTRSDTPLEQFLKGANTLSARDKRLIVDQAIAFIEGFYAHLPSKRAMYAVDPVQQLRVLRHDVDRIVEDRLFHARMTAIFSGANDLHLNYHLPSPYKDVVATLPFRVERCWEGGGEIYIVAGLSGPVAHPKFAAGVTITHWNGVPIHRAVERSGERGPAANEAARKALGADGLTCRCLFVSPPPDEDWVTVNFLALDGSAQEARFDWTVIGAPSVLAELEADRSTARGLAMDVGTVAAQFVRKTQFASAGLGDNEGAERTRLANALVVEEVWSALDCFRARIVRTSHGTFGYIRIWTFVPTVANALRGRSEVDSSAFAGEFIRLLGQMPDSGLIVDVRDNGGGVCQAAERIVQTLTPRTIVPGGVQFINTPQTQLLIANQTTPLPGDDFSLADWAPSAARAVETGAVHTGAYPMHPRHSYNDTGQCYRGPVVAVISARSYSATDFFAASFQDHEVGPILGVDASTGAGGANVWSHGLTLDHMRDRRTGKPVPGCALRPLPQGVGMRISLRRSLRVGRNAGVQIEDLGVAADHVHRLTRRDVLEGNADLIEAAGALLAGMPRHRLDATAARGEAGLRVELATLGLDRVDVWVDGRPAASVDVADGISVVEVMAPLLADTVALRGFLAGELRAANRVRLLESAPEPLLLTTRHRLEVAVACGAVGLKVELRTARLDRVEFFVDGQAVHGAPVADGVSIFEIPAPLLSHELRVEGHAGGMLAAIARIPDLQPVLRSRYTLDVTVSRGTKGMRIELETAGLDRVDCHADTLDFRHDESWTVSDGAFHAEFPAPPDLHLIEFSGYSGGEFILSHSENLVTEDLLVATCRHRLKATPGRSDTGLRLDLETAKVRTVGIAVDSQPEVRFDVAPSLELPVPVDAKCVTLRGYDGRGKFVAMRRLFMSAYPELRVLATRYRLKVSVVDGSPADHPTLLIETSGIDRVEWDSDESFSAPESLFEGLSVAGDSGTVTWEAFLYMRTFFRGYEGETLVAYGEVSVDDLP